MEGALARKLDSQSDALWEELINGKVVMMAPATVNHHRVSYNVSTIFHKYLNGKKCEYFPDGVGLYLSDKDRYIPDGMVVCDPEKVKPKGIVGAPDLVLEVLSRSTAKNDRGRKKEMYERCGVREYWIADPIRLSVEQYVLEDGKFVLRATAQKCSPEELEELSEEDRAEITSEFPCAIFEDLIIRMEDVFGRVTLS